MKHKVIFNNGLSILALGQGTWNLGRSSMKQAEEEKALRTGIDLGMTCIDTAEMYKNETFIGKVIKNCRDKIFLISKVLPQNASKQGTIEACEGSLKRLKTDYIDLYLLHWKSHYPLQETIEGMVTLQKAGKIRQWGVSNLDVEDMESMTLLPNGNDCSANQVVYNLVERGIEYDLIPWCQQHHTPVIAYSPLGEGALTSNETLKGIAWKYDATPAQIILAWTLRLQGVMAIPKAGTVEHVKENFGSLSIDLSKEDFAKLDESFPPPRCKSPLKGW